MGGLSNTSVSSRHADFQSKLLFQSVSPQAEKRNRVFPSGRSSAPLTEPTTEPNGASGLPPARIANTPNVLRVPPPTLGRFRHGSQ